jgi:hypothetical protein
LSPRVPDVEAWSRKVVALLNIWLRDFDPEYVTPGSEEYFQSQSAKLRAKELLDELLDSRHGGYTEKEMGTYFQELGNCFKDVWRGSYRHDV